jgi:hypothetical protein
VGLKPNYPIAGLVSFCAGFSGELASDDCSLDAWQGMIEESSGPLAFPFEQFCAIDGVSTTSRKLSEILPMAGAVPTKASKNEWAADERR